MSRSSLLACVAVFVAITGLAVEEARADAVPPPPETCVDGAVPDTCHGGPYCALDTCAANDECQAGEVCQVTKLCTEDIDCGGQGGSFLTDNVLSTCTPSCAGACTEHMVCVKSSSTTTSTSGSGTGGGGSGGSGTGGNDLVVTGCACSLENGALGGVAGAVMLVTGVLGLVGRRRRRRPSR